MSAKHILLTTDLSPDSRRAYGPACELAQTLGARITLLYVVQVLTKVPQGAMLAHPVVIGDYEKETESARTALREELGHLTSDVEVTSEIVIQDNVADGIVQFAKDHGVDLIATSTHGRSGLRRMVLGSVTEGILRHAHVPVLCFPPAEVEEDS